MAYIIGPVTLRFLTDHNWVSSQVFRDVSIIQKPVSAYSIGQKFEVYNLIGAFNADTAAEARIERQKINDLFNNSTIQQVYIEFSGLDEAELSGWYALDSLDTSIEAAVFENYLFTASVRRLYSSGAGIGQVWKTQPYNSVYINTPLTWLAMPTNRGPLTGYQLRQGELGNSHVWMDVRREYMPLQYEKNVDPFAPSSTDKYDLSRCQVWDSTTQTGTNSATSDPVETTWVERYGTHYTFQGDAIFGNDLIRYIWSASANTGAFYLWTGANWERTCQGLLLTLSDTPSFPSFTHKPIVEYFDWNKIIWTMLATTVEKRAVVVRCKIIRGSYFVSLSVKSDHGNLDQLTMVARVSGNTHTAYSENLLSSNYRAAEGTTALGTAITYGLFYTQNAFTGGTGGDVPFGSDTPVNVWNNVGYFSLKNPSGISGLTVAELAKQYLANMNFKEQLVNFREFV